MRKAYELIKNVFQTSNLDTLYKKSLSEDQVRWGVTKDGGGETSYGSDKKRRFPFGMPELIAFGLGERQYRSKLETRLGTPVVSINTDHLNYKDIVEANPSSKEAMEYIIRAMAIPMATWESQKAIRDSGVVYETPEERVAEICRRGDDLVYAVLKRVK